MTISLRANNDGSAVILVQGQPRITLDPSGNIIGVTTPPYADSSQKLANTEFVLSRGRSFKTASILSASYTMTAADIGKEFVVNAETGSVNITLPSIASVSPGAVVRVNTGSLIGSNRVNVRPAGSDIVFGSVAVGWTNSNPIPLGNGEWAEIVHNGSVWQLIDSPILLDLNGTVFQGLIAGNGWKRLPGGIIFQWGGVQANSTGVTWTFPVPFPNTVYRLFPVVANGSTLGYSSCTYTGQTSATIYSNITAAMSILAIGV